VEFTSKDRLCTVKDSRCVEIPSPRVCQHLKKCSCLVFVTTLILLLSDWVSQLLDVEGLGLSAFWMLSDWVSWFLDFNRFWKETLVDW
jgi:hypothetical protein